MSTLSEALRSYCPTEAQKTQKPAFTVFSNALLDFLMQYVSTDQRTNVHFNLSKAWDLLRCLNMETPF